MTSPRAPTREAIANRATFPLREVQVVCGRVRGMYQIGAAELVVAITSIGQRMEFAGPDFVRYATGRAPCALWRNHVYIARVDGTRDETLDDWLFEHGLL